MTRTDDLRDQGARDRTGGGGGTPFVVWPQGPDHAYIEGEVTEVWEGKYGMSATLHVTDASPGLAVKGKDEDGDDWRGEVGPGMEVNVGLNYAALEGSIRDADVGEHLHVAFEGWSENKAGDRYRNFAVLEVPTSGDNQPAPAPAGPEPDDDMPF